MERKQRRTKVMEDRLRLGQFVTERRGAHFEEVWVDGYAFMEINKKLEQINAERDEIARASQLLKKRKPPAPASAGTKGKAATTTTTVGGVVISGQNSNSNDGFAKPEAPKE